MIASIHQPNYLPWMGLFDKICKSEIFVFLDDVQYSSRSSKATTNRNKVKTAQGWRWLTVPVRRTFPQILKDVVIDESFTHWTRSHTDILKTCYSEAPHFDEFYTFFEEIYARKWKYLCELNIEVIKRILQMLNVEREITRSSSLGVKGAKSVRLAEICKRIQAETYIAGGMSTYLDRRCFEEAGVKVKFQAFRAPVYPQVHPHAGFIQNLSIIDALFCWGPKNVEDYIKGRRPDITGSYNHLDLPDDLKK